MNKIALALILLILPFSLAYTSPRKKVGIVLSGGGAKGVAHIGVIKALEELNIPIDYIAGTSIGAIIGGLYSIGYTSEQLETIVKQTDWIDLLTDKVSRKEIPFPFKSDDSKYLISFPINNSGKNGGIIKGKNISQLLHQLTEGYQNVTNFDSLPIPFACIATDMVKNQKEVIRFGKLSEAMRASMAVPVVFSPIYSGQKVLIDGGFKDNLPIDVVKAMGADIIIGIDVQSELSDADNLHSIAGIANQLMLMICQSSLDESTKDIDAYIKVDVENYNAASFTKAAIDTLIIRGENAAKANYNTLLSIKNRVGIVNNKKNNKTKFPLFYPQYAPSNDNQLRIGLRFDSEDIAAVMLNINLNKHKFGKAEIAVRGGKQSFLRTQYHFPISKPQWITLSNQIGYNDIFLYSHGYKISNPTFIRNTSSLIYSIIPSRNLQIEVGTSLDYHQYYRTLVNEDATPIKRKNLFLNYHTKLKYETLNKRYFPTKGLKTNISYTIHTDLHTNTAYSSLATQITKIFPIALNTFIIPTIYGRFIFNDGIPFMYSNVIGGEGYNPHYEQQIPFSGLPHTESTLKLLGNARIQIRHKFHGKQYLTLSGNYAIHQNQFSNFLQGKKIYGTSIGYGYDSPLGPIEGFICYSNRTNKLGFYLNIGFGF